MIDQKTPHLNLPLPHADNLLEEDVGRLSVSLLELDKHAAATDATLQTKADVENVNAALQTKADGQATQAALNGKAEQFAVDAALAEHRAIVGTSSSAGHVQIATDAEAMAGTATDRVVNPKQLKEARDAGASPARHDAAASYTSAGTGPTVTGFKLASGTDIGTLFGKLDAVENATAGSGSFVTGVSISVNGKNVKMTQSLGTPGFCGYCTHCAHCTHCSYCGYCTHCGYCSYCRYCDCSTCHC